MSVARSGLQKDVLHLYRRALRLVKTKPEQVPPRNVSVIEHLLRQGTKQVEQFEDPGVKDCFVSREMTEWIMQRAFLKQLWFPVKK